MGTNQTLLDTQRLRESGRVGIAILNTRIQFLRNTPCFRKDRANTGFKFCAIYRALERTEQILDCALQGKYSGIGHVLDTNFDPHVLGIILYDTPCYRN